MRPRSGTIQHVERCSHRERRGKRRALDLTALDPVGMKRLRLWAMQAGLLDRGHDARELELVLDIVEREVVRQGGDPRCVRARHGWIVRRADGDRGWTRAVRCSDVRAIVDGTTGKRIDAR